MILSVKWGQRSRLCILLVSLQIQQNQGHECATQKPSAHFVKPVPGTWEVMVIRNQTFCFKWSHTRRGRDPEPRTMGGGVYVGGICQAGA